MNFNAAVRVPEEVLFSELDNEAVLLNVSAGQYFGLDAVGTTMWQVLTSAASAEAAYVELLDRFDVSAETLRADIECLLQELMSEGLVYLDGESAR